MNNIGIKVFEKILGIRNKMEVEMGDTNFDPFYHAWNKFNTMNVAFSIINQVDKK